MLCFPDLGFVPAYLASRFDERGRVIDLTTGIALITSRTCRAAFGTSPFDVPVWQISLIMGAIKLQGGFIQDVAMIKQVQKELL